MSIATMKNLSDIYMELRDPIFGYLLRLSGDYNLAEELTQDTFYRALLSLPKFRQESSVKTWLYAIARNTYLNWLRKNHSKGIVFTSFDEEYLSPNDSNNDPVEQLMEKERRLIINKSLYSLPETYRTVIILREFEELSYIEIANILGKTENWVRVTLFRAKQKLREIYADGERRNESEI